MRSNECLFEKTHESVSRKNISKENSEFNLFDKKRVLRNNRIVNNKTTRSILKLL